MTLETNFKKFLVVILAGIALSACATQGKKGSQLAGDVYTGNETVEYLATGVKDRVFFATNKSTLTTASRERKVVLSLVLKDMQMKEEQENITWLLAKEEQMQLKII